MLSLIYPRIKERCHNLIKLCHLLQCVGFISVKLLKVHCIHQAIWFYVLFYSIFSSWCFQGAVGVAEVSEKLSKDNEQFTYTPRKNVRHTISQE